MSGQYGIAAGHEETLRTAAEVLDAGGNAFDAAIAAYAVAFVAEPAMASAGGGAFAMTRTSDGEVLAFDFFCQTPRNKRATDQIQYEPIEVDFGDAQETYYIGVGSSAIPGSIAGMYAIHNRLGHMPMRELLQPAIRVAREGVPLNAFQRLDLYLLREVFGFTGVGRELFLNGDEVVPEGTIVNNPLLSDFLDVLAIEGSDLFYKGEIAKMIHEQHRALGGHIERADIEAYKVHVGNPRHIRFGDKSLYTMPYPSAGGAILTRIIDAFNRDWHLRQPFHSVDHITSIYHIFTELDHYKRDLKQLFGDPRLRGIKDTSKVNRRGSTSHMSILDKEHNAIALTMTIGEGCGVFIPGTGIHMNNMLGELSLQPEGLHTWQTDTRLNSMMAPTIVQDPRTGEVLLLGSGGASRIPFMLAQVVDNLYNHDMALRDAIEAPRIHFEHNTLQLESSKYPDIALLDNHAIRHWKEMSLFFGGVHGVRADNVGVAACGDRRRDGKEFVKR